MRARRRHSLDTRRLARVVRDHGPVDYPEDVVRPRTRADCLHGPNAVRPCPWVSCRWHLYLDVNPETGSIKLNFPDKEVWELEHTCALDVADQEGLTLLETGVRIHLTRERVRQVEGEVLGNLQARLGQHDWRRR